MRSLQRAARAASFVLCLLAASEAAAQSITIAWDPNTEPEVAGYMVHYGTAPDRYDGIVDVGSQTMWTLAQTASGNTYYFRVLAYTSDGLRSPLSAQVSESIPGTLVSSPVMSLDAPRNPSSVSQNVMISGWAADLGATTGSGVDAVHVWAYPNPGSGQAALFVGIAALGIARPDVATAFGMSRLTNSGFIMSTTLAAGVYDLVAFAHSAVSGSFNNSRVARVTVVESQSRPAMAIDLPSTNATVSSTFRVAGWALDLGAVSGAGVDAIHVWGYPVAGGAPRFAGASGTGVPRPDVAAAFGSDAFAASGYEVTCQLQPGTYDVVVFARSTVTGTFNNSQQVRVSVGASKPYMAVDAPAAGQTVGRTFTVAGWAIDQAASSGVGVDAIHAWAYPANGGAPVFAGATTGLNARSDIAAAFGAAFLNSGFSFTGTLPQPGTYSLVVYARSTVTGTFNNAISLPITVQ